MDAPDLIYVDEVLPEIEIREVLSVDQMMALQPRFVAFTMDELAFHTSQLVKDKRQAMSLHKAHRSILEPVETSILEWVLPKVQSTRILHDNDEDLLTFIEESTNVRNAPNYLLYQRGLDRLYFPFEGEGDDIIERNQEVELLSGEKSKTLDRDPNGLNVHSITWRPLRFTPFDTLQSRPFPTQVYPTVHKDVNSTLTEVIKMSRPSITDALKTQKHHMELRDLLRLLYSHGHSVAQMNAEEVSELVKNVSKWTDPKQTKNDSVFAGVKSFHMRSSFIPFWDAAKATHNMSLAFASEEQKNRRQMMYSALVSASPISSTNDSWPSPSELSNLLHTGTYTMDEAVQKMKELVHKWDIDTAAKFIDTLLSLAPLQDLEAFEEGWKKPTLSIQDERSRPFTTMYKDMHEIKEGNDTTLYDGAPRLRNDVYEEIENEYIGSSDNEDDVEGEALSMTLEDADMTMLSAKLAEMDLLPGELDVLSYVTRMMWKVHKLSGLSFKLDQYVQMWRKVTPLTPSSRVDRIKMVTPDISDFVARSIVTDDLSSSMQKISDLRNETLVTRLSMEYPRIFEEWVNACQDAIVKVATIWWLDLCSDSMKGTLAFQPSLGITSFLSVWSPYGYPMETTQSRGILPYLSNVIEYVSGVNFKGGMTSSANDFFATMVAELKDKWSDMKKTNIGMDKSSLAKLSLVEAINAMRQKQPTDLKGAYIQALLYLPGLLQTKKRAKQNYNWVQGCCAMRISDEFEADMDFREKQNTLFRIKQGFAKKRWNQEERPIFTQFGKTHEEGSVVKDEMSVVAKIDEEPIIKPAFKDLLEQQTWIPRSHLTWASRESSDMKQHLQSMLASCFGKVQVKNVQDTLDKLLSSSIAISLLSFIGKDPSVDSGILRDMQKLARKLSIDTLYFVKYMIVYLLVYPGTYDGVRVTLPSGTSTNDGHSIWTRKYDMMIAWSNGASMMTSEDVHAYITKMREKQKNISLQKLDVLSVEDRELMLAMKKLGLEKLTSRDEIIAEDETTDIEGEREFAMASADADGDADAL